MKKWLSVIFSSLFFLLVLLSINEYLLQKANHLRTIVSDADLWSIERDKVNELRDKDLILLGASRMQVNIALDDFKQDFSHRKILQLALSGRGSSFPVFKDIVQNTKFNGLILISETQLSLSSITSSQQEVVNYYHNSFSLDKKLNKNISMWFQKRFLFLNPNSNSERLWGNVIGKQQLPAPMFTMTYSDREQTSFFDITDTEWIFKNKIEGVKHKISERPQELLSWKRKIMSWKPLIEQFEGRGGEIVFVHMPFSSERWELENSWMPKEQYWDEGMRILDVPYIHFADHTEMQTFALPDTSHLNSSSKPPFTEIFSKLLNNKLNPFLVHNE